ncbi:MAG TPA: hypothetical protein VFX05_06640 [Casimicrobiaceae bacterium]|nr:hypothetical protein [Casimicrobiaceae bacterium]
MPKGRQDVVGRTALDELRSLAEPRPDVTVLHAADIRDEKRFELDVNGGESSLLHRSALLSGMRAMHAPEGKAYADRAVRTTSTTAASQASIVPRGACGCAPAHAALHNA